MYVMGAHLTGSELRFACVLSVTTLWICLYPETSTGIKALSENSAYTRFMNKILSAQGRGDDSDRRQIVGRGYWARPRWRVWRFRMIDCRKIKWAWFELLPCSLCLLSLATMYQRKELDTDDSSKPAVGPFREQNQCKGSTEQLWQGQWTHTGNLLPASPGCLAWFRGSRDILSPRGQLWIPKKESDVLRRGVGYRVLQNSSVRRWLILYVHFIPQKCDHVIWSTSFFPSPFLNQSFL